MATTTATSSAAEISVHPSPFPAKRLVSGHQTTITSINFTDKLLITISQAGRLSHWVHVPLATASADQIAPSSGNNSSGLGSVDPESALLPRSDLTATTVLGGTKREEEVVGQTLGTVIGSAVLMKRAGEQRLLVLGLGLVDTVGLGREGFEEVVGLVLDVL
ncbi:hypothetical protein LTR86_000452 [Recurvomyces mirabilis]|nr:hypothetical protein LTR86_000452 [Recurvomyces mirabilis]